MEYNFLLVGILRRNVHKCNVRKIENIPLLFFLVKNKPKSILLSDMFLYQSNFY